MILFGFTAQYHSHPQRLAAALCDVRWWEARWDGLVQERRILENCRNCSVLATCSPLAAWRSFWIQGWGPLFLACSTSEKCREWDCGRTGCSSSVAFIPASWWCGHLASLPKHDILYNWILVVAGLVLALCFTWLHMQGRRSASVLLLAVEIGPQFNCGGGSGSAAAHLQSTEYTEDHLVDESEGGDPWHLGVPCVSPSPSWAGVMFIETWWWASSDHIFRIDDLCCLFRPFVSNLSLSLSLSLLFYLFPPLYFIHLYTHSLSNLCQCIQLKKHWSSATGLICQPIFSYRFVAFSYPCSCLFKSTYFLSGGMLRFSLTGRSTLADE